MPMTVLCLDQAVSKISTTIFFSDAFLSWAGVSLSGLFCDHMQCVQFIDVDSLGITHMLC